MKLTLIGGAGVRTPLMVNGLVRWHQSVPIEKLVLYDVDEKKLQVIGELVSHLVREKGAPFQVEVQTDLRQAVSGADFIYTAIRVGGEKGRVVDEKIPLKYGVLGQETTGPGGFAMALRTIPVMLEMAEVIEKESPGAWVVNFTNPSGLITEALLKHSSLKVIGICDAPSSMKLEIAKFLGETPDDVYVHYFGLNHLGWVNRIMVKGEDRLPELLQKFEQFTKSFSHMASFSGDFIRQLGMLPNEYLYYYYYRDQTVRNIANSEKTRGEQIVSLNETLITQVSQALARGQLSQALDVYENIMSKRTGSYMQAETGSEPSGEQVTLESEGYEGLAMAILESVIHNEKDVLVLNVQNNGAISELRDDDVVEVSCVLDRNGPLPIAVGTVPDSVKGLIQSVKQYERLTVSAAVTGDYDEALFALTVHPLVCSQALAKSILDDYLEAHALYLPQFRNKGTNR